MAPESKSEGLKSHKISDKSLLFNRVIPILFVILAVVMGLLIVFAVGVLTGIVSWT